MPFEMLCYFQMIFNDFCGPVLSQSGNHMEHSIIAACIALLLGCTIQDNFHYTTIVRNNLPNLSFEPLVEVLQKLRDFAFLAVSVNPFP